MLRRVMLAEAHQPLALLPIHGLVPFTRRETLPRLHLRDHERLPAPHDEIDLARREALVFRDKYVAAEEVVPAGVFLTEGAEFRGGYSHSLTDIL
jgi:hypothetical protein